ncbi:hypothetical protein PC129_g23182 [Phytophthora cactorum]|uniref:Uncharacterized protein n=1 Tax=Phytophthora cactorum TaxID=29920 RepID=A0A329S6V8_9STRA|nr:hypothetical protein Pcac1_g21422 [Phytophthora cactorum]KAG2767315.1 hypothetical protein Pcac1_g21416 [Phytophthora cactorum]KAG3202621.1 hypothetical protein PC129_g23182 [Phytophthora cactorum]RAW23660.1 hypothetical protein PC110_g19902 [Phytophthora cactorum]RAW23666.1 hypothetical protein PC110_g19908 [Phytophthora cactorum]
MEVLLLDTTEKEGEDNTLYHYVHCKQGVGCFSTSSTALKTGTTQWLDLRGVLAAAVGATTSLCGESLQCARFGTGDSTGIVGFVNIYEVLYALVFSSTDVPESIVQYYTRSSCDLVLSFFGYPDAKLNQWRRRDGGSVSTAALNADLDAVFKGVFSIIQQDLSFGSSLHFAFDGRVPAVNYPLEIMANLAVLDMPFGDTTVTTQQYSFLGRCIFYRKQLAFSTMRNDLLQSLFQWLLAGDHFTPDSTTTWPPTSSEGSPTRLDTFELHDFRFARHGEYPKRHAFLLITHDNLQLACLVERKLEFEGKDDAVGWAKHLAGNVNQRYVEDLAAFCDQHLETYLKSSQALRHQRTKALQAPELQREIEYPVDDSVSIPFLWYSVALDRLRGVIISDELHNNDQKFSVHQQIMTQFVQHIAASQRSSRCLYDAIAETSPELPSGIPPLKLNVDDPDALFLREKVAADAGDDISTGDAHIFPEWCNMHMKKGREQRQTAEQIVVCGQPLWIIKNSYESLEVFSILDAALPLELVDRELDRLCAFGGAEPVQQLHSE